MAIITKEIKKPHPNAVEKRELRSTYSKTWVMPDGKFRCETQIGTNQHYISDEGDLRSCDTTIQQDNGKVFVDWLPYKFKLHDKGIGFDFQSRESGKCSITLVGIGDRVFDNKKIKPSISENKITFSEVSPGIDIIFQILPSRVKSWRIIKDDKASRKFQWICEYDADGRDKIDNKLIGKDSAGNELELVSEMLPIDDKSFQLVETWTGNVKIRDRKTRIKSISGDVKYPVSIDPTVSVSPTITEDDGTQYAIFSGAWSDSFSSFGMYMNPYNAGLRFPSVNVPQGAIITSAILTIKVNNTYPVAGSAKIYGVAADNPLAFSSSNLPSTSPKTTAFTTITSAEIGTRNYTVTSIVQEIVNRAGFSENNAIAMPIIGIGYGYSRFDDYDDVGNNHASLSITYTGIEAVLTGTIISSTTETDIVSGGKTIILTLTGDTWVASGATFNSQRQNIINGIDSAQAEATGWNAVVKANQSVSGVVRTSDTVVTIILDAQSNYNINNTETITITIPGSALVGGNPITATPNFTINPIQTANLRNLRLSIFPINIIKQKVI